MTRQTPDWLEHGSRRYQLYPMLPLLPPAHPRWAHCRFASGDSTANYRGYGAQWMVAGGRLYLKSFGGYAEESDGLGRHSKRGALRRQIGLIDVHEVDTPVPARWISRDLWCLDGRLGEDDWSDFRPQRFKLFRVVRGEVVGEMSVPNHGRVQGEHFREAPSLLDELCGGRNPTLPTSDPASLEGLAEALRRPGGDEGRRRLAAMLWAATRADLDDLIQALSTMDDPDLQRWVGYAIAAIGPDAETAIPPVMRVVSATADPEVAQAMAYAIGGIGRPAASVFKTMIPLVEALCGRKADKQVLHFAENVAPVGPEVAGVLIDGMLTTRSGSVDARISWLLGQMGAAVLPLLHAAYLDAVDDGQRASLAGALGYVGPAAGATLEALLQTLQQTEDDDTRFDVAEAVAKIGLQSPASLAALRPAFRHASQDRTLRQLADAAASLGGSAVGFLVEELEFAGNDGRRHIARALGEIGIGAASAADPLARIAEVSTSGSLAVEVATSLKKIGAPAGCLFRARIKALESDPPGYWAQPVLGEMQAALDTGLRLPDQDVWDLVALMVETGESPTGRAVAKMLGAVGKAATEPLLIALDQVRDQRTRAVIFHALGQVGEPAGSAIDDAVIALSAANEDRVRLQIVDDLVRLGQPDERHMATIAEVLLRSSFLPVWWRLGLVLAGFGAPAVPILLGILDQASDDGLCRAMENALLEAAHSDAAAGTVLLSALRRAYRPRTRAAVQAALNRPT
ncbi:HEAT repeat domain-containing protein [Methylobacterium fujisawaense]|jgi:hypothetical protein